MYRGCQKIYTHFKRFCLCKMCIHFLAPSVHIYILYIYIYTVHTHTHIYICTEGAKKCIHILRDVIYVKCVYIFGTLCTYTYMYSTHTHIYMYSTHTYIYICVCVCVCTEGAKKCIQILHRHLLESVYIFWHPLYVYIYICVCVCVYCKYIYIYIYMYRGCQKIYTYFKRFYLCKMSIHLLAPSVHIYIYIYTFTVHTHTHTYIYIYTRTEGAKKCIHFLRDIYVKCVYIFWHPLYRPVF